MASWQPPYILYAVLSHNRIFYVHHTHKVPDAASTASHVCGFHII